MLLRTFVSEVCDCYLPFSVFYLDFFWLEYHIELVLISTRFGEVLPTRTDTMLQSYAGSLKHFVARADTNFLVRIAKSQIGRSDIAAVLGPCSPSGIMTTPLGRPVRAPGL